MLAIAWRRRFPLEQARHRRMELEAQGATVYWSERLVPSHSY